MTDGVASNHRARRPRGFFWQGVVILLPVVVLVIIGLISIRQDKALAEREATERARLLADDAADAIWSALSMPSRTEHEFAFTIDGTGALRFPPPSARLPSPAPLETTGLTPEQVRYWETANTPETGPEQAVTACRQLLATDALKPERLEVMARFRLAGLLATSDEKEEARRLFSELSRLSSETRGETGLPLAPLARLKWIELTERASPPRELAIAALRSNALAHPGPLTPFLLARASELRDAPGEHDRWQSDWERHETIRWLHAAAADSIRKGAAANGAAPWPRFLWFHTKDPNELLWRAARTQTNALGATYDCRLTDDDQLLPMDDLGSDTPGTPWRVRHLNPVTRLQVLPSLSFELTNAAPDPFVATVAAAQSRLPPYLGLTLEVAGHTLISSNHLKQLFLVGGAKGAGWRWASTASGSSAMLAQARRFDEGVEALRVGIHLTSPEMLYDRQHARSRIFGLLILAAAVTSVIGCFSARRAYLRQQQLSDMKSNFVSSVSHELRAPLASVRLMAENLEHGKVREPSRQRDYYRFIVHECRRLGTLIENVLDFARIEQGRKHYDFEPTDVRSLVQQTVQLMEPIAAEKNVTLRLEPAKGPENSAPATDEEVDSPAPLLDGPALQQALVNLVNNAIKHSPAGASVTVDLSFKTSPPLVSLSVQDQGPGIPASEHARIFERFYRRGPELRRETQGVGIGLSIVKHIAEAHGGRVRVESQVGRGSRFILELPWKHSPGSPLHAARERPTSATQ